jgi:hypothetical protein
VDARTLRQGIAYQDYVVRNGACGYKVSVWSHDIRAYLTDDVDEKRGEGRGMGIWVQVGPKFLMDHAVDISLKKKVKDFLRGLGVRGDWETRITRIDLAIDLLGIWIGEEDIELWRRGWVGRSGVSACFFNSKSRELETIYIGSRNSAVYLRVYDKVIQAVNEGDLEYWLDIWQGHDGPVTRVEWEVKPNKGGFRDLEDFNGLCEWRLAELLNYLTKWGRLCVQDPSDTNNRRWQLAKFWKIVDEVAKDWVDGINWPISRKGKEFKGVSEEYIKFVGGTVAGAMARMDNKSPNLYKLLEGMEKHGMGLKEIQKKADEKAAIYSRL